MNNEKIEFLLLNKLMLFMMVFIVAGLFVIGVSYLIKHVYRGIENPAGAVIRLWVTVVFSILIWRLLPEKMRHLDLMNIPRRRQ